MRVHMIAAMSQNRIIGLNNTLPWHLPDDLAQFKRLTKGCVMIMGRNTFESLPGVLPGRLHWVVSRNAHRKTAVENVMWFSDLHHALNQAKAQGREDVMIIGGAQIYKEALPFTDLLHLTTVNTVIDGDVSFPELNLREWQQEESRFHPADAKHPFSFNYQKLQRAHLR